MLTLARKRGVSHGFISDKPKEDKLATFPLLSCFLFYSSSWLPLLLVEWVKAGCQQSPEDVGLWGHWTEESGQFRCAAAASMNLFAPQSILPVHGTGFNNLCSCCCGIQHLCNWLKTKLLVCLKTSKQEMKLSVGLMFFKWASPLTVLLLKLSQGADQSLVLLLLCCQLFYFSGGS